MHKELKDSLNYIFEKEQLAKNQKPINFNKKKRKSISWIPAIASIGIVGIALLLLSPYFIDHTNINQGSEPPVVQTEKTEIFNYKGTYIGDNSSVGQILSYSMDNNAFDGFQIYSSSEPYGLRIFMGKTMGPSIDYSTIVTASSYLFTLIRNIDFVEFEYLDYVYTIDKSELESAFDINYYSQKDEASLQLSISKLLSDEKSKEFIHQIIK